MKTLLLPVLWLLAIVVSVWVLWRLARGRRVVLRGRVTPTLARMVIVVLVSLGIGSERVEGQGARSPAAAGRAQDGSLPAGLDAIVLTAWRHNFARAVDWRSRTSPMSEWAQLKAFITGLEREDVKSLPTTNTFVSGGCPETFRALVIGEVLAVAAGLPAPQVKAGELLSVLGNLERRGYFDPWVPGYFWRRSEGIEGSQLPALYSRLARHARVANTLLRAANDLEFPLRPRRAWTSKAAGPSKVYREREAKTQRAFARAVSRVYDQCDAGPWVKDGTVTLEVFADSAPVTLYRDGVARRIEPGESFEFGRLDVLAAPSEGATLRHALVGRIDLVDFQTAHSLPLRLSAEAVERVAGFVRQSAAGDAANITRLQSALPLVNVALRDALIDGPNAPAAPAWRTLLFLFDDAVLRLPHEERQKKSRELFRAIDAGDRGKALRLARDVGAFAVDGAGHALIHRAAAMGDRELLQLLLDRGVDIELPVEEGRRRTGSTPLLVAAAHGQAEACAVLLERGAKVNGVVDAMKRSPLLVAAEHGDIETVRVLLDRGADVSAVDAQSQSVLVRAVLGESPTVALLQLLIEHGADPAQRDRRGKRAADHAVAQQRSTEIRSLLDVDE